LMNCRFGLKTKQNPAIVRWPEVRLWCGRLLKKNRLTGFNAILSFFAYFGN